MKIHDARESFEVIADKHADAMKVDIVTKLMQKAS